MTYSPSPASRRRFGSPERRVHPAPTSSLNGTHNALTHPRSENYYDHHAPFHLEHALHADHPLRHPNAVHWRSAYSVISLHRKYKELRANGGVPVRDPTRGSDNGSGSDGLLSNARDPHGGENPAEVKRLAEENLQLKLELDQKTKEVEEIKIENEETKQQLEQKTKELEEKDHAMEQLQTKLDDVACQLKRSAENSAALHSKMSEAGINVDSLMEQLAEMQAFRETLIRKAATRWLMSGVASTFNNWKSNVNEIVSNRRLIARFSARWTRSGLHGSFVRWHDMARTERRNRGIIKKFAARFSNQIVSKCFHKWQHLVQDNNRLQRLQQKVAQRFMQQKLSAAFHGWYVSFVSLLAPTFVVVVVVVVAAADAQPVKTWFTNFLLPLPLFLSSTLPLFHSSTLPLFHSSILPCFHHFMSFVYLPLLLLFFCAGTTTCTRSCTTVLSC